MQNATWEAAARYWIGPGWSAGLTICASEKTILPSTMVVRTRPWSFLPLHGELLDLLHPAFES